MNAGAEEGTFSHDVERQRGGGGDRDVGRRDRWPRADEDNRGQEADGEGEVSSNAQRDRDDPILASHATRKLS